MIAGFAGTSIVVKKLGGREGFVLGGGIKGDVDGGRLDFPGQLTELTGVHVGSGENDFLEAGLGSGGMFGGEIA